MKPQHKSPKTEYENAEATYLSCQKKLKPIHAENERLEKQCAATIRAAKEAGEAWRAKFRESHGQASESVRKLKAQENEALEEVGLLEELIREQAAVLAGVQQETAIARNAYVLSAKAYRYEVAKSELSESAEELFEVASTEAFLKSLAVRLDYVMSETLADSGFMGGLGFVELNKNNESLLPRLTPEDRKRIDAEVERRKHKIVFELVNQKLKGVEKPEKAEFNSLPRLACEKNWKKPSPAAAHFQGVVNAKS